MSTRGRVWRVRKVYRHIDAEIDDAGQPSGVELRILYSGRVIYSRRWETRALAEADAQAKLTQLERAGWTSHW